MIAEFLIFIPIMLISYPALKNVCKTLIENKLRTHGDDE